MRERSERSAEVEFVQPKTKTDPHQRRATHDRTLGSEQLLCISAALVGAVETGLGGRKTSF